MTGDGHSSADPAADPAPSVTNPSLVDSTLQSRLDGLTLETRRRLEGSVTGRHRSRLRGFSAEFAEHREYVAGDDLRYVDWKVYGRSDRYHLKQFEDETNFSCWLVLDTSESMSYRSANAPLSKLDHARRAAAALAWLVLRQSDAVGMVTVAGRLGQLLPPSTQPSHLGQLNQALLASTAEGPTGLGSAFADLASRLPRPAIVICFSDLFDDLDQTFVGLEQLAWRGHDVVVLQVIDPAEQDFPFEDPTRFVGMEGEADQVVEPRALADAYRSEFRRFLDDVSTRCRSMQMDHLLLRTDVPLDDVLPGFLQARRRRGREARP